MNQKEMVQEKDPELIKVEVVVKLLRKKVKENEMVKAIFYTFVVTVFCGSILWFYTGRITTGEIERDIVTVNGDLEEVQRNLSKLRTLSDGFAGDLLAVTEGVKGSRDRVGVAQERVDKSVGVVGEQLIKMDELRQWHKASLILGRDLGDVSFNLRRLREEYEKAD